MSPVRSPLVGLGLLALVAGCSIPSSDDDDTGKDATDDTAETDDSRDSGDPPPPDGDDDTIPDAQDNCPEIANTDQANADGDLWGDACDPFDDIVHFVKEANADPDDAANQDCLETDLCITRGSNQALYNASLEDGFTRDGGQEFLLDTGLTEFSPAGMTVMTGLAGELDDDDMPLPTGDWTTGARSGSAVILDQQVWTSKETEDAWQVMITEWQAGGEGGAVRWSRTPVVQYTEPFDDSSVCDAIGPRLCVARTGGTLSNMSTAYGPPSAVEVALGPTWKASASDYDTFESLSGTDEAALIGQVLSFHVIGTDVYYDVVLTSWDEDGGASWSRSRALVPGCTEPGNGNYDAKHTAELGVCGDWTWFVKDDGADPSLAANQDCITSNVCLTRASQRGIYNAVDETEYDKEGGTSPKGTTWAGCFTDGAYTTDYMPWIDRVQDFAAGWPRDPSSVYLVEDDAYHDMIVIAWTPNADGGRIAWFRKPADPATVPPLSVAAISGLGSVCTKP